MFYTVISLSMCYVLFTNAFVTYLCICSIIYSLLFHVFMYTLVFRMLSNSWFKYSCNSFVDLSFRWIIHRCIYWLTHVFVNVFVHLSFYPSIHLSICELSSAIVTLLIYLSIYLPYLLAFLCILCAFIAWLVCLFTFRFSFLIISYLCLHLFVYWFMYCISLVVHLPNYLSIDQLIHLSKYVHLSSRVSPLSLFIYLFVPWCVSIFVSPMHFSHALHRQIHIYVYRSKYNQFVPEEIST